MAKRQLSTWRIDSELMEIIGRHFKSGRRRRIEKNETLYEQGTVSSKFYVIEKGLVKVSIVRSDGTEILLEYMGPQTICGEGAAFDSLPRFSTAIAAENTDAVEFDAARIDEIFRRDPEFALALLRVTSLKQRVLAVRLEHLVSREPEGRIMELLHRLAAMFGSDHPTGRILITKLTHEDIAAMTGTSRVTVTRALQRLRDQQAIDLIDGHLLIKS